jgi:hypothetical protein
MTTRNRIAPRILVVLTLLILSTFVFAHGNEQRVRGTVAKIDAASISVKTADGGAKTVMIAWDTKFVRGTSPATQQDLRVGDRVVIHVKSEGGMLHATQVQIGRSALI